MVRTYTVINMKLNLVSATAVKEKKVLLRVDYNVPLAASGKGWRVADETRLKASLETIAFLRENGATVFVLTHLGRPGGKVVEKLSTLPVARALEKLLGMGVVHCGEVGVDEIEKVVVARPAGSVTMLENSRFWPEEKKNDRAFAKRLAAPFDVFVNDGFAVAHRAHLSVEAITHYLPSFAGFGLQKEVQHLYELIAKPKRPFVTVVGGAKICDKVEAVEHLAQIANVVLVGGGVANNFLAADGYDIADSYLDESDCDPRSAGGYVHFAEKLLQNTKRERVLKDGYLPLPKIIYPTDVQAAANIDSNQACLVELFGHNGNNGNGHKGKLMFLDIGPRTIKLFKEVILGAGTVFWNGPMGVYENSAFADGTREIAKAIAKSGAHTVIGGGDTIAAINHFELGGRFDYVSAAGGAALEFLAGKMLPGIKPLLKG